MEDIKQEYERIITSLYDALSTARAYERACREADRNISHYHIYKKQELYDKLVEVIGDSVDPVDPYSNSEIPSASLSIDDATHDQIAASIIYDIRFFERGLAYLTTGNHRKQASFLDDDLEGKQSKRSFTRQDYSDATIYVFFSSSYGVARKPSFVFKGLDACADFFMKHIEACKESKDVRGSIWKALKDSDKGRTMFGYRFSLNKDLNNPDGV